MDSDFEAYRREKIYRRRQKQMTERPGGTSNDVWEELEAREEHELKDQQINREVDDFFSAATKIAAGIVQKVRKERKALLTGQVLDDMEDFLADAICRARNLIQALGVSDDGAAEKILTANMKNLVGQSLDEFRAEGTAQIGDKHFGQDPFMTELDLPKVDERIQPENEKLMLDGGLELTSPELALDLGLEEDPGFRVEEFSSDLSAARHSLDPSLYEEDAETGDDEEELPLAALHIQGEGESKSGADSAQDPEETEETDVSSVSVSEGEEAARTQAKTAVAEVAAKPKRVVPAEERQGIKDALLLLVRQGIMTRAQAQAAYRKRIQGLS